MDSNLFLMFIFSLQDLSNDLYDFYYFFIIKNITKVYNSINFVFILFFSCKLHKK